jgi:hypothetical protein
MPALPVYLYQSKDRILQLSLSTNNGTFRV